MPKDFSLAEPQTFERPDFRPFLQNQAVDSRKNDEYRHQQENYGKDIQHFTALRNFPVEKDGRFQAVSVVNENKIFVARKMFLYFRFSGASDFIMT